MVERGSLESRIGALGRRHNRATRFKHPSRRVRTPRTEALIEVAFRKHYWGQVKYIHHIRHVIKFVPADELVQIAGAYAAPAFELAFGKAIERGGHETFVEPISDMRYEMEERTEAGLIFETFQLFYFAAREYVRLVTSEEFPIAKSSFEALLAKSA